MVEVVGMTLFAVVGALGSLQLPTLWRGESAERIERQLRPGWPWGGSALKGWIRSLPAAVLAGWSMFLLALIGVASSNGFLIEGSPLRPLGYLALPAIGMMIIGFVHMVTVILFNRPKYLVPPSLRKEPGLVHAWWRHSD